jgi:hypothetical protein
MTFHTLSLEIATPKEKSEKGENISTYFKIYVFVTVFIEFLLLIGNIGIIIGFQNSGFIWTKALQLIIGIRFMLLFFTLVSDINVYKIKGVNMYYRTMTHFSYYTSLGIWILFGFIFLYFIYWWIIIVDLVHFLKKSNPNTAQFIIYIIVDFLFIIEHWMSYILVYKCGIVRQFNFYFPKEKENKKKKMMIKKKNKNSNV